MESPPNISDGNEYRSFFEENLRRESKSVQSLAEHINAMFDEWEEERAKEVVYRMDGLNKFFQSVVVPDNDQETDRFLERLQECGESFATLVEASSKIPVRQIQTRSSVARTNNPVAQDLFSRIVSPLRAGWWVRLAYLKTKEPTTRGAYGQVTGFWGPSPEDVDGVKQSWTIYLCETIIKVLSEIGEPYNRPERRRGFGLNNDAGRGRTEVMSISSQQMTSKNKLNELKLSQFEYLWALARAQLEADIISGDRFLTVMVNVMKSMHTETIARLPKFKGPLPLFVCYLFVSKLLQLAPFMSELNIREFWKLCSINLRVLYWSRVVDEVLQSDVVFEPYADLLQGAIRFVALATPPDVFREWEREIQRGATSQGNSSTQGSADGTHPTWWTRSPMSASSGDGNNGGAGGLTFGQGLASRPYSLTASGSPANAQNNVSNSFAPAGAGGGIDGLGAAGNSIPVFPLCTLSGRMTADLNRQPAPPPAGVATAASVRSTHPGGVALKFPSKRKRKRAHLEAASKVNPWLKFELIPNTPSLHYLLRGARKVKRTPLHPNQAGLQRSASLQSTHSYSSNYR